MPVYHQSVFDGITAVTSRLKRKISDHNLRLLGTKVELLRITTTKVNLYGDTTETVSSSLINNVYLKYPLNEVELFAAVRGGDQNVDAINLWNIMPIEMVQYYEGDIGDTTRDVKADDILVNVIKDNVGNVIPIPMQVIRQIGMFEGKYLIRKKYELSLVRGKQMDAVQQAMDEYVGVPYVKTTVPDVEVTGFPVASPIVINWNIPMNTVLTSPSFSITPTVTGDASWDVDQKVMTFTPTSALTAATRYDFSLSLAATSVAGLSSKKIYTSFFTTS